MADPHIHTYHCICTELVLALFTPLENLPKRKSDGARICKIAKSDLPVPAGVVLSGSTLDAEEPIVMKLDDGFEKRFFVRCGRCDLRVGYRLDRSQFGEDEGGVRSDVLYLMAGGLMSTEDMTAGKTLGEEDGVGD